MFKTFKKAMDPVSSETHFIGAILSFMATIGMLIIGWMQDTKMITLLSVCIFGLSSIALYSASFIYHYYNAEETNKTKLVLRKLDHSMIYVLIAGSYTPIALTFLDTPHGYYFTACIWGIALLGTILKVFWMEAPRYISTIFYLLMGWALVFDFPAFYNVPIGCFVFLALGGLSYTIGALVYGIKKPNWFKQFGFHELFHIFVMIGSLFHFIAVYVYIL